MNFMLKQLNALIAKDWGKAATMVNKTLTFCIAADNKGNNALFFTHKIKPEDYIKCLENAIENIKKGQADIKIINEKTRDGIGL